jgi:hypothetical protein
MDVDDRRRSDPLEQRLDRWVSAGRQLVDGVTGTRPGLRASARPDRGDRQASLRSGLNGLGKWMEHQLDQFLEEDEENWREPWQDDRPAPGPSRSEAAPRTTPGSPAPRRRPLEAISRRGERSGRIPASPSSAAGKPPAAPAAEEEWPGEETFTLPRWRRSASSAPQDPPTVGDSGGRTTAGPGPGRPLPRSSRRRQSLT